MPDWRELYKTAVLETDPTQLKQRITETEAAIFMRLEELAENSDDGRTPPDSRCVVGPTCFETREAGLARYSEVLDQSEICPAKRCRR
jgi:hypothetical protein